MRWKTALRESRIGHVPRALRRERRRRAGPLAQAIEVAIAYLEGGRSRMDHARFEREGWPIGSGAVETTRKHLV